MLYDDILKCLRTALAGTDGGKAALRRAIAPESSTSTFYRALKEDGAKLPAPEELCGWLDALGCKLLSPGTAAPGYSVVPRIAARAGAGSSTETSGEVIGGVAFETAFLRRIGMSVSHAMTMDVVGDSMFPLLRDGDTVLVDTGRTTPTDGKIYVLSVGDELLVKRLQRIGNGLNVLSENPAYPPLRIEGQDLDTVKVRGEVRWVGRIM